MKVNQSTWLLLIVLSLAVVCQGTFVLKRKRDQLSQLNWLTLHSNIDVSLTRNFSTRIGTEYFSSFEENRLTQIKLIITKDEYDASKVTVKAVRTVMAFSEDAEGYGNVLHQAESTESGTTVSDFTLVASFRTVCDSEENCKTKKVNTPATVTRSFTLSSDHTLLEFKTTPTPSPAPLPRLFASDLFVEGIAALKAGTIDQAKLVSVRKVYALCSDILSLYARWCKLVMGGDPVVLKDADRQIQTVEDANVAFSPAAKSAAKLILMYHKLLDKADKATPDLVPADNQIEILERFANALTETFGKIELWAKLFTEAKLDEATAETASKAGEALTKPIDEKVKALQNQKQLVDTPTHAAPKEFLDMLKSGTDAGTDALLGLMKSEVGKQKEEINKIVTGVTPAPFGGAAAAYTPQLTTLTQIEEELKKPEFKKAISESLFLELQKSRFINDTGIFTIEAIKYAEKTGDAIGTWFKQLLSFKKSKKLNEIVGAGMSETQKLDGLSMVDQQVVKDLGEVIEAKELNAMAQQLRDICPTTDKDGKTTEPNPADLEFKTNYKIKFDPKFKAKLDEFLEKIGVSQSLTISNAYVKNSINLDIVVENPFKLSESGKLNIKASWERKELKSADPLTSKVEVVFAATQQSGDQVNKKNVFASLFGSIDKEFKSGGVKKVSTGCFISVTIPFEEDNATKKVTQGPVVIQAKPSFQINFNDRGSSQIIVASDMTFTTGLDHTSPKPYADIRASLAYSTTLTDNWKLNAGLNYNVVRGYGFGSDQFGLNAGISKRWDFKLDPRTPASLTFSALAGLNVNSNFKTPIDLPPVNTGPQLSGFGKVMVTLSF